MTVNEELLKASTESLAMGIHFWAFWVGEMVNDVVFQTDHFL